MCASAAKSVSRSLRSRSSSEVPRKKMPAKALRTLAGGSPKSFQAAGSETIYMSENRASDASRQDNPPLSFLSENERRTLLDAQERLMRRRRELGISEPAPSERVESKEVSRELRPS